MKRILVLISAVALSACISLLPKPPPAPRTFVMQAGDIAPATGAPVDAVINVADPSGERSILGNLLVWRTGDELAYVDQTQWSTRAEDALQQMLVETLSAQHRFRAATRTGDAAGGYEVRWEVLEFNVQQNNMTARFRADVKLVASPGRRVIAQRMIEASAPVADRSATLASQALTKAARDATSQIAAFAADTVLQDQMTQQPGQPQARR